MDTICAIVDAFPDEFLSWECIVVFQVIDLDSVKGVGYDDTPFDENHDLLVGIEIPPGWSYGIIVSLPHGGERALGDLRHV